MLVDDDDDKTTLLANESKAGEGRYGSTNDSISRPLLSETSSTSTHQHYHHQHYHQPASSSLFDNSESVALSWENLNVTLRNKRRPFNLNNSKTGGPQKILKNVSGVVRSGTLLAIMGASGSGKTTLLNTLTNRNIDDLDFTGSVKVNGRSLGSKIANISAYVQQEDLFVGVLTVKEHLWFQAMLRMDQRVTAREREQRINDVIRDLGLQKCENTVIGVPGKIKAISGGERKRLSFATEVLMNPKIMFCDEPTSGLDSFMAETVVQNLKVLAGQGKAILCTIHQPSSDVFNLFDNLLLLAEGRLVYLGTSAGAREFFTEVGYPCPLQFNPADFYMKTLAVVPGQAPQCRERIKRIAAAFRTSENGKQMVAYINEANDNKPAEVASSDEPQVPLAVQIAQADQVFRQPLIKANCFKQFACLTWRASVANFRDMSYLRIRLLQNIFIALFTGLVFFGQKNDQKGVQNINGCLFLICTNMTFSNAFGVILTFTAELPLFLREHQNGTYRTSIYYLCKQIADLPFFILNPIIFTGIAYWMVGLRADIFSFLICTGGATLLANTVASWGYMLSAACGEGNTAVVVAGPVTVPFILFSGFLINDASIPVFFIWMKYLSWFKYANEIFVVNQWHNFGDIGCEYLPHPPINSSTMAGHHLSNSTIPSNRCFQNGDQVVDSLSYSPDNLILDFILLAVLMVAFRIIGFIFLCLRANPIRIRRRSPHDPIASQL